MKSMGTEYYDKEYKQPADGSKLQVLEKQLRLSKSIQILALAGD